MAAGRRSPGGVIRRVAVVIPAYQPGPALHELVRHLSPYPVIVVNDGSGPEYAGVFDALDGSTVVHHARNLGKGAALKTGIHEALHRVPDLGAVVTADADGQHSATDILRVAEAVRKEEDALVLGVRHFGFQVPFRCRFGNRLTRSVLTVILGHRLSDSQTGLRGIPARLLRHLTEIPSDGYEFELDMLVCARYWRVRFLEVPIATIYVANNEGSPFNPLLDSLKIYFVLLRFSLVSLAAAAIDNTVFVALYQALGSILWALACGRLATLPFNYFMSRRAVFLSGIRHGETLPKYLLLVLVTGAVTYAFIRLLHGSLGMPVLAARLLAEGLLFPVNFIVQRNWVFRKKS